MVVTDYFSAAVCINLPQRTDKRIECENEFIKHGLSVGIYPAIDGNKLNYNGPLKKGVIGCAKSHLEIILGADAMEYNSILIFEDDVAFDDQLNDKFNEWIKEVPEDWDMLYFGGNHNVKAITNKISDHVFRATDTQTTHAYAVRHTVYDRIIKRLQNIDKDVDVIYMDIQKTCNAYCFTPRLAWQRAGVSDIWQQYVDYSFLKDNDGLRK